MRSFLNPSILPLASLRLLAITGSAILSASCAADEPSDRLAFDCAGRFVIGFPRPAQIAATPNEYFSSMMGLTPPAGAPRFAFLDGEPAGYASAGYSTGSLLISQPQPPLAVQTFLKAHAGVRLSEARKTYEGRAAPGGGKYSLEVVNVEGGQASAWLADPGLVYLVAQMGDRLVDVSLRLSQNGRRAAADAANQLVQSLRGRDAMTVPADAGVCLPYLFVRDDGSQRRNISMTYRMDAVPDVQLTFKDATAVETEPGIRTKNAEPGAYTVSFWSQLLNQAKEVKPLWSPSTRSVKLAGYAGLASFVQLTREDGTIDFGYLAVVRGDPKAKEDSPDLLLYIVQDSKRARSKGKVPVARDEFIALAERVAASVQRRAVTAK